MPEGPFDLAIVGGGINGAAAAREAVLRGLRVCLFEKGDFGSGTSSRSSKMLHGGMRYLEQLQFRLVFEALRERAVQLQVAPHLSGTATFVIPVYRGAPRGPRWIRLGIFLYDLLALGRRLGKGRFLSRDEVFDRVPGLSDEGLLGGGLYFDGVMDDARLCLANVLDAREAVAPSRFFARNWAEVASISKTSPLELVVRDRVLREEYRVLAHNVLRVVGPWSDLAPGATNEKLLVPSKGIHIVLPALESSTLGPHGLLLTHSDDDRVFFVIPWRGKTLVGTTETPFDGDPGAIRVEPDEVNYLLGELNRLFPSKRITRSSILGTFAGVRPLARSTRRWGRLGSVSRKHRMVSTAAGLHTIVGGKYTNYRAVAEHALDVIAPGTPRGETRRRPLHGGELGGWEAYQASDAGPPLIAEFGESLVARLFGRYGSRVNEVLELVRGDSSLGEPLSPEAGALRAEVVHGVRREAVCYPVDFLRRRTDLRWTPGNGREVYDIVEELIREHGGSLASVPADLDAARAEYLDELAREDELRGSAVTSRSH